MVYIRRHHSQSSLHEPETMARDLITSLRGLNTIVSFTFATMHGDKISALNKLSTKKKQKGRKEKENSGPCYAFLSREKHNDMKLKRNKRNENRQVRCSVYLRGFRPAHTFGRKAQKLLR